MIAAFRLNLPVIYGVIVIIGPYLILLFINPYITEEEMFSWNFWYIVSFIGGFLYTHLFEWYFHHGPMHHRMKFWPIALMIAHMKHHKVFYGDNYQSRDPDDLKEITGTYYRFPILVALHYVLFLILFPAYLAPMFFLGETIHLTTYEITHWYSHLKDNLFDKVISYIPILNSIRSYQIEHHRIHHEEPIYNFAFNPPYLWDYVFKTKK